MAKSRSNISLNIPPSPSSTSNRSDSFSSLGIQSYGTITFRRNYSNRANFIRIPPNAPIVQIKELFFQKNRHKHPELVISITGSVKEYSMKSRLFQIFRQGLLKIAKTTDVSIITCGINTSVTKLIGEIIRTNSDPSRPIHLIGIAQWGCIAGVEQLDVHGTNVIYTKSKSDEKDKTPLEPNHTHFIFIDDGTKHQYDAEIQFRHQFERAISLHSNEQLISSQTPVVLVVIEGGLDAIKKVHETVMNNNIPVVLMEGTGGCCDLFARCSRLYNEYQIKNKSSEQRNEDLSVRKQKIHEKLQSLNINLLDTNDGIDYFELIYECIEKRNRYINFIDLKVHNHLETDVDLAILQALLNVTMGNNTSKMNLEQKREQLNLAFEWKRIDIIKNFIMKDDQDWRTIDLNDLFEKALLQNQITFVQLFLDHDFPLNDLFENNNKLLNLYQNENYILHHDYNNPLRAIYKKIIQPLIGDFFEIDAIFDTDEIDSINDIDVEKELFLWSILTNKPALALLFWARGKNKVCAALIATLLYKSKARKEKDERYIKHADEFQTLAVEILEKFYVSNPYECTQAIIRQIPQFGNVTWLHLAVMAEAKLFIAERAVQDVLNDIWYGYIDHRVGNTVIVLTSFIPWYSGFLPYHKELVEGSEKCIKINSIDEQSNNFFKQKSTQSRNNVEKTSDLASTKLMDEIINEENAVIVLERNPCKSIKSGITRYLKNVFMFLNAPCVKYLYNLYFHIAFLALFSYVILFDFFPLYDFQCIPKEEGHSSRSSLKNISTESNSTDNDESVAFQQHDRPTVTELILSVWVFTLFCEEIRQILAMEVQTLYGKIFAYFAVFWNKLDVLAIFLFFLGFLLRFLPLSHCFCAARILLAIDLSIWYMRTLDIFSAIKRLGPKLVMIGEMVHDMKFYMVMLTVFILAYGVPAYSLIYGVQKFSWHIPRAIINLAYWQMFGELEVLDEIEKNYEITGYVVFILLIAYMTISSVLLINLLIAMFSNTFDRLHMDTDCIWKFQHYSLVCYHLTRPILPPPLLIFSHMYLVTIYICSHVFKIKWFHEKYIQHNNQSKFKIVTDEMITRKIEAIEDALGNEVYFFSLKTDGKQVDRQNDLNEERVHSPQEIVLNKIKTLENQIQTIQNQQGNMFEYLEYLMNGIKKIGGDDIDMPKRSRQDPEILCML